jgi:hypothetical protein
MSAQKIIGGRTYSFGTLPATKAVTVEITLVRIIGEPLLKFLSSGKSLKDINVETVGGEILGQLAGRLNADEIIPVMTTVFEHVSCDGLLVNMDATFTGRLKEMHLVFFEALKVNFADFFSASPSASPP